MATTAALFINHANVFRAFIFVLLFGERYGSVLDGSTVRAGVSVTMMSS
ncbi:DUF4062 domain-containing protein [Mycolicibacterium elephantis]|nr:DUF4062 domain-containing protein [Mycolicibacterium elephantis]